MEPNRGAVFVSGATGYVGRFLVRRLVDASRPVRCLALPEDTIEPLATLPVELVRGDVTRLETLLAHGDGVGSIVHAAAAMLPNPPALVERVNVEGTRNVLAFAKRWGVTRFVYVSAVSAVYAHKNSYGRSKAEAERLVRESGLRYTILRPTMVYGPGGGLHFETLVALGRKIPLIFPVLGPGTARLQPVWIDDLIDAIVGVLDAPSAYDRTYDVSGATALAFRELVDAILRAQGRRRLRVHAPLWACRLAARALAPLLGPRSFLTPEALLGLNEDAALDHGELTRDFGFRPRTLESGLAQLFGERRRISQGP
jgi:nucleoside-diphosphate-sugar epimerase